jgi:hypothetical protein
LFEELTLGDRRCSADALRPSRVGNAPVRTLALVEASMA